MTLNLRKRAKIVQLFRSQERFLPREGEVLQMLIEEFAKQTPAAEYPLDLIQQELAFTQALLSEEEKVLDEIMVRLTQLKAKKALLEKLADKHPSRINSLFTQKTTKSNPKEFLKDRFKGQTLAETIVVVLSENQRPMTVKEIARQMFNVFAPNDIARVQGSLGAELRSESKRENPRWKKLNRSLYAANNLYPLEEAK